MTREIKFRAWLPDFTGMIYSDDGESMDNMDAHFGLDDAFVKVYTIGWIDDDRECISEVYKDAVVMQYTDLHDKDGEEIYEGDIVKSINGLVGKIIFENGSYVLEYHDAGLINITLYSLNHYDKGVTEVIGNIYENPELLEA